MSDSQPAAADFPAPATGAEELYSKLTVAAAAFFLVLEGCYLVTSAMHGGLYPPIDVSGYELGRDFINVWMGGRSASAGSPATALLVTATFLATPWSLTYDLVVLGWVVDLLRRRFDNAVVDHRLAIAVWTLPVTAMLAGAIHIPLAVLVLMLFTGRLLWRLSQEEKGVMVKGSWTTSAATVRS